MFKSKRQFFVGNTIEMRDTQNNLNNSLVWKHNAHFFPKDSENVKTVSCLKETERIWDSN